jgi:uncharacterized membrane protein
MIGLGYRIEYSKTNGWWISDRKRKVFISNKNFFKTIYYYLLALKLRKKCLKKRVNL